MKKVALVSIRCCIAFLFFTPVHAQDAKTTREIFPDANVAFLSYEKVLKLAKKDGLPYAESEYNFDILMLTDKNSNMLSRYKIYHSGYSELVQLEASTKVPAGKGKYRNVKVQDFKTATSTQDNVFYDDNKETSFDFPNLVQDAIGHVSYKLRHKDVHLLMPFYIPDHLPVQKAVFRVEVPDGIYVKYRVQNDPKNLLRFTEEKKQKSTFYTWTVQNYKPEDFYGDAPSFRHYLPHVILQVTAYDSEKGKIPFLSNLDDLYKWNYSFTKELNRNADPALSKLTDSLVKETNDPIKKATLIYKWVQNHIKYIAFENGLEGFRPRQAAEVYTKRYGDCKDMSSILTQMLNMAGLNAYYTWIGTRDLPYRYSEVPLPIVDNHMITALKIADKWYFLDATNPLVTMDLPPSGIQGKEALVAIGENDYKILVVPVASSESNIIVDSTFISFTDQGIKGLQKVDYTGYFGQDIYSAIRYRSEKEKEDYVKSRMGKGSNKFILGKYEIIQANPSKNHAKISAEFEIPDYSKKVGSEYFINLNLEKLLENRVVMSEKRKVPISNEFKFTIIQHHILEIPENYKVSELPDDLALENDLLSVKISYTLNANRIIATQEVKNKTLLVNPSEFEEWNNPIKALQPRYKESIVLKPIN